MKTGTPNFGSLIKQPSAFLPAAMSLTALTLVLINIAIHGAVRGNDEDTTAHVWQILMAGQVPVILFFAVKWLPRAPRLAFYVLANDFGAALASLAVVFFFKLG